VSSPAATEITLKGLVRQPDSPGRPFRHLRFRPAADEDGVPPGGFLREGVRCRTGQPSGGRCRGRGLCPVLRITMTASTSSPPCYGIGACACQSVAGAAWLTRPWPREGRLSPARRACSGQRAKTTAAGTAATATRSASGRGGGAGWRHGGSHGQGGALQRCPGGEAIAVAPGCLVVRIPRQGRQSGPGPGKLGVLASPDSSADRATAS
jgi:hypothetical protein